MLPEFQIFENIEDGVLIASVEGKIIDINTRALQIFGYTYEEVVGKFLSLFMFEKDAKFHNLFIQNYLSTNIASLLRKGKELDGKDKNNNKIPLYISVIKYFDKNNEIKFIGFVRELKRHIFFEDSIFKNIFLVSNNYKISVNLEGEIIRKNELYSLLNYDIKDSLPNNIFDVVHKEDLSKLQLIFEKIRQGIEINNIIIRIKRKDKKEIFFLWNSNLLPSKNTEFQENQHYHYFVIASDITNIVEKDKKISVFENTIEDNPTGILIADSNGFIEYTNETFLKYLKLKKYEVLMKNLFKNSFFVNLNIKNDILRVINKNGIWEGEITNKTNEIEQNTFFLTIKGIKDQSNKVINYIEMVEDISILKSVYNQIEIEKNKFNQILQLIPQGILLFNENGNIIELNLSLKNLYTTIYKKDLDFVLKGKNLLKLNEKNHFIDSITELFNSSDNDLSFRLDNGKYRKIFKIKIDSGFIFIYYDITEEKKLEELRNQIISTVSHELRTPISSVTQSLYNFINYGDKLNEKDKERLITIAFENSKLLGEIVDDLLVISQIESNKLNLELSKIDLSLALNEILEQLSPKIQNKQINIIRNFEKNCLINGDLKRIHQIFRIIIDNSIKYSLENSGIEILIKHEKIKRNIISVEIKDQGIGIEEDEIPNLFNRFFRAKNASKIKGTGLGLSIAKDLVELHKGEIFVKSEINKGSSFIVIFPESN